MDLHTYGICDSDSCNSREPRACARSQRLGRFCPSWLPSVLLQQMTFVTAGEQIRLAPAARDFRPASVVKMPSDGEWPIKGRWLVAVHALVAVPLENSAARRFAVRTGKVNAMRVPAGMDAQTDVTVATLERAIGAEQLCSG